MHSSLKALLVRSSVRVTHRTLRSCLKSLLEQSQLSGYNQK